jgi:hypothetical protein
MSGQIEFRVVAINKAFALVALVWFLGWGVLLLRFPTASFRVLSWGRRPTPKNLKTARVVGYMGVAFAVCYCWRLRLGWFRFDDQPSSVERWISQVRQRQFRRGAGECVLYRLSRVQSRFRISSPFSAGSGNV